MEQVKGTYKDLRVIIAGGGTGGHVFPAIAIATALKKQVYQVQILFVGAKNRMEMQKVPAAGFHILGLDISGIQRKLSWKNLLLPIKVIRSLAASKQIVKRFKPDVVIGVGGYASGPLLWAAANQKVPLLIQEQNSYPGITNRLLAKKAKKICVAFNHMEKYFPKEKIFITGNPVRQDVIRTEGKYDEAMDYFGLSKNKPVLFVTGGSLGAGSINEAVASHIRTFIENGIQVIWQTGTTYIEEARRVISGTDTRQVYVNAFIDRMDYAFAAADVVVSRAGAIAVSEICAVRKPAVLIPSPNVAEDHQTKNAMALVNHHAAILLKDEKVKPDLGHVILDLIHDEDKKQQLKVKIAGMAYRDAAEAIAGVALSLVGKNS